MIGRYLKLVALDINAIEASIVDDKIVKNITEVCDYFTKKYEENVNVVWLILPCSYELN